MHIMYCRRIQSVARMVDKASGKVMAEVHALPYYDVLGDPKVGIHFKFSIAAPSHYLRLLIFMCTESAEFKFLDSQMYLYQKSNVKECQ